MKKFLFFCIISVILIGLGCGNDNSLEILHNLAPELEQPAVVSELTQEAWDVLKFVRELPIRSAESVNHTEEHLQAVKAQAEYLRVKQEDYYKKYVDAGGIPIVGPDTLDDQHLINARTIILMMTAKRPGLREAFVGKFYIAISSGCLYQLPEYNGTDRCGWIAGTLTLTSELWYRIPNRNIGYTINTIEGDTPYDPPSLWQMRVVIHEFAHAVYYGPIPVEYDQDFYEKLKRSKKNAREKGLYSDKFYRDTNINYPEGDPNAVEHYWTEAVDLWFYCIGENAYKVPGPDGALFFKTTEEFAAYDPVLYEILSTYFPEVSFCDGYCEEFGQMWGGL
ncbi:MAG: hypothetical protein OXI67_07265 [Candidatus Poribacteria bacterium]|nr:hypothetical protein [Candidatus Poribacteria bacterium]